MLLTYNIFKRPVEKTTEKEAKIGLLEARLLQPHALSHQVSLGQKNETRVVKRLSLICQTDKSRKIENVDLNERK